MFQNVLETNRRKKNVLEQSTKQWKVLEYNGTFQKFVEDFRSVEESRRFQNFVEHSKCYFWHHQAPKNAENKLRNFFVVHRNFLIISQIWELAQTVDSRFFMISRSNHLYQRIIRFVHELLKNGVVWRQLNGI